MWSFIVSVIIFAALIGGLGFWQHRSRKTIKSEATRVDQEINKAAEIAQRRHVQRFGKEDTGLQQTLSGPIGKAAKSKAHP
jgi:hypothetical protein